MTANLWRFSSRRNIRSLHFRSLKILQAPADLPHRRTFSHSARALQTFNWSSAQYLKFADQRTIPLKDLLAKVPLTAPKRIIDLGCGPGNSTAVLKEKFPDAKLTGIDSSNDMLEAARRILPDLDFVKANLVDYRPPEPTDLLVSNAVFHWLPQDKRILTMQRLLKELAPGGVLAIQVPTNTGEPSHISMKDVARKGPWAAELARLKPAIKKFAKTNDVYNGLKPLCSSVDIWRTHYYHVLDNHQAIVEWVMGSGLRPFLDPLSESQQETFLREYHLRLQKKYKHMEDGKVMLRYPRLFIVAVRA